MQSMGTVQRKLLRALSAHLVYSIKRAVRVDRWPQAAPLKPTDLLRDTGASDSLLVQPHERATRSRTIIVRQEMTRLHSDLMFASLRKAVTVTAASPEHETLPYSPPPTHPGGLAVCSERQGPP